MILAERLLEAVCQGMEKSTDLHGTKPPEIHKADDLVVYLVCQGVTAISPKTAAIAPHLKNSSGDPPNHDTYNHQDVDERISHT